LIVDGKKESEQRKEVRSRWSVVSGQKEKNRRLETEDFKLKAVDSTKISTNKKQSNKKIEPTCRNTQYLPKRLKFLLYSIAGLLLAFTLYNAYSEYQSAYFFSTGNYYAKIKKNERALFQYQKGLAYKKEPKYIYKAGMLSITSLNNPELALHFFNYFNIISSYDYAHKNGFIALSLIRLGKTSQTLPYLVKETVNYPLSAASWFRLALIQRQLRMHKAAEFSLKNMRRVLSAKGLPPNALQLIIENPKYDSHPDRIPKEILLQLQNSSNNK